MPVGGGRWEAGGGDVGPAVWVEHADRESRRVAMARGRPPLRILEASSVNVVSRTCWFSIFQWPRIHLANQTRSVCAPPVYAEGPAASGRAGAWGCESGGPYLLGLVAEPGWLCRCVHPRRRTAPAHDGSWARRLGRAAMSACGWRRTLWVRSGGSLSTWRAGSGGGPTFVRVIPRFC